MVFDITDVAKNYCNSLNTKSSTGQLELWDFYYYCALIGLRYQLICSEDTTLKEFNKSYTKTYLHSRMLIAGLLIDSELKRTGQKLTKDNISKMFAKYTSPVAESVLNSEGIALLNRYAQGGFEYFCENASTQSDAFSFINTCIKLINKGPEEIQSE